VRLPPDRQFVFTDENGTRWRATHWYAVAALYRVQEVVPFWRFWQRAPGEIKVVSAKYIEWCRRNSATLAE